MNPSYTEDYLVEQPAIALFAELGWATANCHDETFGSQGGLSRENVRIQKLIIEASEKLRSRLDREATLEEICDEAGITLNEYYLVQQLNNLNFTISLDGHGSDNNDEKLSPTS